MAEQSQTKAQERDSKSWSIIELFYRSLIAFREIFDHYERRVLQLSTQRGQDRLDLRLEPEDLAGLMDFRALERLRDEHIFQLKDICHEIFRGKHRTDVLDLFVSDVFHEISILKEEHYNVKMYAPQYARDSREVELRYILNEVHDLFPSRLRHIRYLFGKALERLEELLPTFTKNRIVIRSLYLRRNDFVKDSYENGIQDFYRLMYPQFGVPQGYFEVGKSFYDSHFTERAAEALSLADRELATTLAGAVGEGPEVPAFRRLKRRIRLLRTRLRESGESAEKVTANRRKRTKKSTPRKTSPKTEPPAHAQA